MATKPNTSSLRERYFILGKGIIAAIPGRNLLQSRALQNYHFKNWTLIFNVDQEP